MSACVHMHLQLYICRKCLHLSHIILQHSPPLVHSLAMMIFVLLQDSWSPLLVASAKGYLEVVNSLIEAGANVNQSSKVQFDGRLYAHP